MSSYSYTKDYQQDYYAYNRDNILAYQRQYYLEHRGEIKERRKEREAYWDNVNAYYFGYANLPNAKERRHTYYMQYRDFILAYLKIWRTHNPEYMKIWIKEHPGYMRIWRENHPNYDKLRYLRKKQQKKGIEKKV